MAQYRYLGTQSTLVLPDRTHALTVFGQTVEFLPAVAEALVKDRAPLLPESIWQSLGITEDEIGEHPSVLAHDIAPDSFIAKRNAAWKALGEYRASLFKPAAPVIPTFNPAEAEQEQNN